jgi:proteasome lid subunit RPN8/RPN11
MVIERPMLEDILAHAREEFDAECCGVIAYPDGEEQESRALQVRRMTNVHATHLRFEIEPKELLRAYSDFDDAGWKIGAIYHSHTRTEPYPSQTDINYAAGWPGVEWLIVGLAGEQPDVRSYVIDGDDVREVPVEVG